MEFSSLTEIIAMGGHGPYVWSSYAVFCVVLLWLVYSPVRRYRALLKRVARHQQLAEQRSESARSNSVANDSINSAG